MNVKGIKEAAARVPAAIIMATVLAVTLFGGTAPATATPTTAAASAATAAAPVGEEVADDSDESSVMSAASAQVLGWCKGTKYKAKRRIRVCTTWDGWKEGSLVRIIKKKGAKKVKKAKLVTRFQKKNLFTNGWVTESKWTTYPKRAMNARRMVEKYYTTGEMYLEARTVALLRYYAGGEWRRLKKASPAVYYTPGEDPYIPAAAGYREDLALASAS